MKSILALDLGTRLGWAFRNSDGCIHHNVENLDRPKGAGRGVKYFTPRPAPFGVSRLSTL